MFPIQIQQKAIQYTPVFHFLLYLWRPLPKGMVLRVKYLLQGKQMNLPSPPPKPHFCWVLGDARVSREYCLILFFLFWKDWPHLTQFMLLNNSVSFHKQGGSKTGSAACSPDGRMLLSFSQSQSECSFLMGMCQCKTKKTRSRFWQPFIPSFSQKYESENMCCQQFKRFSFHMCMVYSGNCPWKQIMCILPNHVLKSHDFPMRRLMTPVPGVQG